MTIEPGKLVTLNPTEMFSHNQINNKVYCWFIDDNDINFLELPDNIIGMYIGPWAVNEGLLWYKVLFNTNICLVTIKQIRLYEEQNNNILHKGSIY